MNRTQITLSIIVVLVLGAAAAWQLYGSSTAAISPPTVSSELLPTAVVTEQPALDIKTISVTSAKRQPRTSFALIEGDSVASWDFRGAYTDNPELITKAKNEIQRLSEQLATATSSAMILSVGIANQYELLGDGKNQYDYLGRAIQASPENGLPWHNLGVLMERLGALETARIAYREATVIQPQFPFYHYSYLEFLIGYMKDNTVEIEKAFTAAEKNIGKKQNFIDLRTMWQTQ